jgi:hypothetical protein
MPLLSVTETPVPWSSSNADSSIKASMCGFASAVDADIVRPNKGAGVPEKAGFPHSGNSRMVP